MALEFLHEKRFFQDESVLFLSPSRQTQNQYLHLEHNSVIQHSFQSLPHY